VAQCATCGIELHPERAEKYDYCTKRECRERNARPPTIAAVAVNKAADHYLVLNERNEQDLASGKHQDQRKSASVTNGGSRIRGARRPRAAKSVRRTGVQRQPDPSWSKPQQDLALIYHASGMGPDEIAEKLGLSRYTVTQMILASKNRVKP
jgi:hypothetical protein